MSLRKIILTNFLIVLVICFSLNVGFSQGGKAETLSFSGVIQSVSKDNRSIVVDKKTFSITHDTKILDQNGKALKAENIKANADVAIDAISVRNGLQILKLVIIRDKAI